MSLWVELMLNRTNILLERDDELSYFSKKLPIDTKYVVWDGNLHLNTSLPEGKKVNILLLFGEAVKLETTSSGVYQGVGGKN